MLSEQKIINKKIYIICIHYALDIPVNILIITICNNNLSLNTFKW